MMYTVSCCLADVGGEPLVSSINRKEAKKPEELSVQRSSRRCARRIQKNLCLSPTDPYSGMLTTGVSVEPDNHWSSQINRLQLLIDKLEYQSPRLEPLKEDTLASTYKSNILLVQRQMSVMEKNLEEFQQALRRYTEATISQSDSLHVSIQKLPERSCFIMYEFWQDRISWMRPFSEPALGSVGRSLSFFSYLQSSTSKTFQRCVIDVLEDPEVVSTMLLPGESAAPRVNLIPSEHFSL
ncbi:hypothetical protein Z043_122636 [Scleropages formosus]|uniref:ABM domain-containing protein n=1 Tax=Scleropages formosus TaxID=113540 RepID=A0A0P7TF75_SCLFO|nr:hypothetical protein Z043_122636 [Scleropages formosus]